MDTPQAVRARGITECFGDVIALDGIDLDVRWGRIHGVVGPNGAGKSTMLGLFLRSLATEFGHLYVVQTQELHRPMVTEPQLRVGASCDKNGGMAEPSGPGNGWRCVMTWHVPGVTNAVGQAIYQLDVTSDGRYVADGDGPVQVNGYFLVRTPTGVASNPLWQFDGIVDLLATKG